MQFEIEFQQNCLNYHLQVFEIQIVGVLSHFFKYMRQFKPTSPRDYQQIQTLINQPINQSTNQPIDMTKGSSAVKKGTAAASMGKNGTVTNNSTVTTGRATAAAAVAAAAGAVALATAAEVDLSDSEAEEEEGEERRGETLRSLGKRSFKGTN